MDELHHFSEGLFYHQPDEIFETSSNLQKLEMCCGGEPQSLVQLET